MVKDLELLDQSIYMDSNINQKKNNFTKFFNLEQQHEQ